MFNNSPHVARLQGLCAALVAIVLLSILMIPTVWAADRVNLSGLHSLQSYDRFIVKFRDNTPEFASTTALQRALDQATRTVPSAGKGALTAKRLFRMAVGADVFTTNRKLDWVDAETLLRQLAVNSGVEYVEVDAKSYISFVPNDTLYLQQWDYYEVVGGINMPKAWDISKGAGVVVAVIDTGITTHSDLSANVVAGYDFISASYNAGDNNGRDSDSSDTGDYFNDPLYGLRPSSWHGTHVAGTIAAVTNNAKGVAGVSYQAKISPVRVLGFDGGVDSDISDAIIWASGGTVSGVPANANPAEVINLSLGGTGVCSNNMQAAINAAVGRGSTIVVAAGNSNMDAGTGTISSCQNVIVVANSSRVGRRAERSNYGPVIDITAPGEGILSTLNAGATTPAGEGYLSYDGTSMSAPHVSGVVAILQAKAVKTPAEIETILKATARPMPYPCPEGCGAGIVDTLAALNYSERSIRNVRPTANFSAATTLRTTKFSDLSSDSDGTIVSRVWNFGDGSTSTEVSPVHTYPNTGNVYLVLIGQYNVSLVVTDNLGAIGVKTMVVTVADTPLPTSPVASFNVTSSGLSANFTDTSTPAGTYQYLWAFGDGTSSTLRNPSRSYPSPGGTYDVTLNITDSANVSSAITKRVTVGTAPNKPPVADFIAFVWQATIYPSDFATDSDGTVVSRLWTFGDGSSSTALAPIHDYAGPGLYNVTLTVTDDDGATSVKSQYFRITSSVPNNYSPMAGFSFTTNNLIATFTDSSIDYDGTVVSRSWSFGDGTSSTQTNPVHTYSQAGTYNVSLTVIDNKRAAGIAIHAVTVTVAANNKPPVASFTYYTRGFTVAERLTAYFTDGSTDSDGTIASRDWKFGDGGSLSSSTVYPSHTYAMAGNYVVTLTVKDNLGVATAVTKTVSVGFPP